MESQQVADAQKFIFVAQGETCSNYHELVTMRKPPILPVVTENRGYFRGKRDLLEIMLEILARCCVETTPLN